MGQADVSPGCPLRAMYERLMDLLLPVVERLLLGSESDPDRGRVALALHPVVKALKKGLKDGQRLTRDEAVAAAASPLAAWVENLHNGRSRLPPLSPETLLALLAAWCHPDADLDVYKGGRVCTGCGLESPRHRQHDRGFFGGLCPFCGASADDAEWPSLVPDLSFDWQSACGYVPPGIG